MPTILGANTLSGGYDVANSLRMNAGDNSYLSRTKGTSTSTKIGTYSFWFKLSTDAGGVNFLNGGTSTSDYAIAYITSSETLKIFAKISNSTVLDLETDREFRDVAAWYHCVIAIDTTQGTSSNRVKIYINGTQETGFSSSTYPGQNDDLRFFTSSEAEVLGRNQTEGESTVNGYLAEFVKIDGTQLTPTSFGEFDEDTPTAWKPIDVSGLTFGTNGFYLEFKQSGTSANSSGLGADTSGNDNHFSVSNLTATAQSTDTCTNNFATINPLIGNVANLTLTEGNLNAVASDANYRSLPSTLGVQNGKWYAEFKAVSVFSSVDASVGIYRSDTTFVATTGLGNFTTGHTQSYGAHGKVRTNNGETDAEATFTDGDIIQVAMDLDNNKLYFGKNNTYINSGDPTTGSTGTGAYSLTASTGEFFHFAVATISSGGAKLWSCNFGSPDYANSSDASDGAGYGAFEFAPPSGYYSLCTQNIAKYG